jgi:hypothetical protein
MCAHSYVTLLHEELDVTFLKRNSCIPWPTMWDFWWEEKAKWWTSFEHFGFPLPVVIPGLVHTHLLPLEGVRLVLTNQRVHLLSGTWTWNKSKILAIKCALNGDVRDVICEIWIFFFLQRREWRIKLLWSWRWQAYSNLDVFVRHFILLGDISVHLNILITAC